MSDDLNAIVGGMYTLSCYRQGFGNYFCEIEILEIKKKPMRYGVPGTSSYSIKYRKHNSPYDAQFYEWYKEDAARWKRLGKTPPAPFEPPKTDVWVHDESIKSWNMRVRKI
jgi:hypothetical protein